MQSHLHRQSPKHECTCEQAPSSPPPPHTHGRTHLCWPHHACDAAGYVHHLARDAASRDEGGRGRDCTENRVCVGGRGGHNEHAEALTTNRLQGAAGPRSGSRSRQRSGSGSRQRSGSRPSQMSGSYSKERSGSRPGPESMYGSLTLVGSSVRILHPDNDPHVHTSPPPPTHP